MRRKTTTLLLLAALLFNSVGYLGFFFAARHRARARLQARGLQERPSEERPSEERLAEGEAVVEIEISLDHPPKDFARISADELWYRGAMYDIVRVEQRARTRRFYAIADAYDTASFRRLAQLVTPQPPEAQAPPPLFSFLKNAYVGRVRGRLRAPEQPRRRVPITHETAPPAPFIAVVHPPPWLG